MWARSRSDDEELLVAVESLRSQLRRTEKSLQSVGAELSRCVCSGVRVAVPCSVVVSSVTDCCDSSCALLWGALMSN